MSLVQNILLVHEPYQYLLAYQPKHYQMDMYVNYNHHPYTSQNNYSFHIYRKNLLYYNCVDIEHLLLAM